MTAAGSRIAGLAICLIALGIGGCERNAVTASAWVVFDKASDADQDKAAAILETRFESILPEQSSVEVRRVKGHIELTFRGEPIPDEKLRYFAATQGTLQIAPLESPSNYLVTDRDVEWAQAAKLEQDAVLHLRVSEAAGKRMLAYSSQNPGSIVVTTWDGDDGLRSTIQGQVSRSFQTSGLDFTTAERRKVVLMSGRLPVTVRGVYVTYPGDAAPGECDWACPDEGKKYRAALAAAIERADRIVVTEHSSPWDAINESAHEPLTQQEIVYAAVTLNATQRQLLLTTVQELHPGTQTWANACLPVWHHTVRFYEQDELASTMLICFRCSHVSWDGIKGVMNPESIHAGMRSFIADIDLHPQRDWTALAEAQLAAR